MSEVRIFWCDDEYEIKIKNQSPYMDFLEDNDVKVSFFRNSDELFAALKEQNSSYKVDAVIFDYNMSNDAVTPDKDGVVKSGFLDILRGMDKYIKKGIPFHLFSKKSINEIIKGLDTPDNKRYKRIFEEYIWSKDNHRFIPGSDSFKETVIAVINEVNLIKTPTRQLRLKYPEAFEAANEISDRCWDHIVRVLSLNPDSEDWNSMEDLLHPLRCDVEDMMTMLKLPEKVYKVYNGKKGIDFNSLGHLISGEHYDFEIQNDVKDGVLGYMVTILVKLLQDGSHGDKRGLEYHVREYLKKKKDVNTLFFIAHLLIRVLIWANKARKFMEESGEPVCNERMGIPSDKGKRKSATAHITSDKGQEDTRKVEKKSGISREGIVELDDNGYLHIDDCLICNYQLGKKYKIETAPDIKGESGYRNFAKKGKKIDDD